MMARKPKPTASITLAPSSDLVFGGHVDYAYVLPTLPTGAVPDARAVVTQNGTIVQNDFVSAHEGFPGPITLGPTPLWQGGGADAVLELGYHTQDVAWTVLATTTFTVAP